MAKFDGESINKFIGSLEKIDESWQTKFNLREVVKKSYPLIKKAKKYKVSWEKIAKILEESCESKVSISPVTIRQYYLELSKRSKKSKKSSKNIKQESEAVNAEAVAKETESQIKQDNNSESKFIAKEVQSQTKQNNSVEAKKESVKLPLSSSNQVNRISEINKFLNNEED